MDIFSFFLGGGGGGGGGVVNFSVYLDRRIFVMRAHIRLHISTAILYTDLKIQL